MTAVPEELETELAQLAQSCGCELAHVEFKGGVLRLVLDRETGVGLEDCERVAKQASPLLDVHGFGRARYTLEVTSPGLDRPLYGSRDYQRFTGRLVRVRFQPPDQPNPRTVVGELAELRQTPQGEVITVVERDRQERLEIPLTTVRTAKLEIDW
jgi:ribosome maturation factor RimP